METLVDLKELREGIRWLTRLRWLAAAGVAGATFAADALFDLPVHAPALYAGAGFMLACNCLFAALLNRADTSLLARIHANAQILLDFAVLTVLLHFSGGLENPFALFYVFHTITAGMLLARGVALAQTLAAIAMFCGVALLEAGGAIQRWPLWPSGGEGLASDPLFLAAELLALSSTLLLSLYVAVSASQRMRQKNIELSSVREELALLAKPKTEDDMLRQAKLSSLGAMAAGIAHEINNPLTVVLINLDLALAEIEENAPSRETLEIAKEEVIRCRGIIEQLLTFSRGEDTGRRVYDARKTLSESLRLIENYARLNRVTIEPDSAKEKLLCRINPNQMKQVLVNIMMNAIQAMPEGGTLRASVGWNAADRFIEFTVEDTGKGISKSVISHIFDPFFSTKKTGEGTGLGLSICHRLVQNNNGNIVVESEENKGTRVLVQLPCGDGRSNAASHSSGGGGGAEACVRT